MEEVLYGVLPAIGRDIHKSIEAERYLSLPDLLETLNSQLSEKARLKLLMKSFEGGNAAITDLADASAVFLEAVGVEAKTGVEALYQTRNFIVHQARNMPAEAEASLRRIVEEFSTFIATVLRTFDRPHPE